MPASKRDRRPWVAVAAAVVVLLVGIGLVWALKPTGSSSAGAPARQDGAWGGSAGFTAFRSANRVKLPAVAGPTLTGQVLDLANLRGHVAVLNVWGSWCAPCRAEAPDLARVANETRSDGVRFVGIDVRDNPAAARAFVRRYKIPYPSLNDANGKVLAAFAGLIPISAVPSTLVVDDDGRVAARVVGRIDAATLRDEIKELLHPRTGAGP